MPKCNKRNVLYENICTLCNPGAGEEKRGKGLKPPTHPPSIYVGETSRTLYERGKEHWRGFYSKAENSHIYKHHQIHHGGEGEPAFFLRPVRFFSTALTRQIAEATRIQIWGEEIVLNSKSEYNRCKIGRLTIGDDVDEERKFRKRAEQLGQDEEELEEGAGEKRMMDWERRRLVDRRLQEVQGS